MDERSKGNRRPVAKSGLVLTRCKDQTLIIVGPGGKVLQITPIQFGTSGPESVRLRLTDPDRNFEIFRAETLVNRCSDPDCRDGWLWVEETKGNGNFFPCQSCKERVKE